MKISVVIPMYNASRMVLKCLQGLAVQEILPHEVIVVDNNSTDNSKAVVQDSMGTFKHLNIILCEESKQGYGPPRNKGARVATGDIVAFTDTDCIPDKSWVKGILAAFTEDKDLDAVGGIDKSLVSPATVMGKLLSAFWFTSDYVEQSQILKKEDFFDNKCIIGFNCAFKKDFYNRLNGCDEMISNGEETDLIMRGVDAGAKIIAWNKGMVVCHYHDISFKSLLRREFYYAKAYVFIVSRHFRNNVLISTGHTHCHWPNRIGLTVVLHSIATKILIFMLAVLAIACILPKFLYLLFLAAIIYFCIKIRKFVKNTGSHLTVKETVIALFFYLARALSKVYGRIYWSFKYKVIGI